MGHIHELYDFTVSAFIVHDAKVLLLHHKKLNTWLQPGGHVELHEDPEQTLFREIEEETGLKRKNLTHKSLATHRPQAPDSKNLPLPFDLNVHPFGNDPTHKHIDLSYLLSSDTDDITINPAESNDLRWFNIDKLEELKDQLLPDIYARAQFAIQHATAD